MMEVILYAVIRRVFGDLGDNANKKPLLIIGRDLDELDCSSDGVEPGERCFPTEDFHGEVEGWGEGGEG